MSLSDNLRAALGVRADVKNAVTVESLVAAGAFPGGEAITEENARKLSAVDGCIEILSNSMAKLPNYLIDKNSRERVDHYLLQLLNVRPNEAMAPSVRRKMLETNRNEGGCAYDWIVRDPRTGRVRELIPVPWRLVQPWRDGGGRVWYTVTHPLTGEPMVLPNEDVCHYKAATRDGLKGISPLKRASEVIASAKAAQEYERNYYERGGQPSGVLETESDIGGYVKDVNGEFLRDSDGTAVTRKELLRREWEKVHAGPSNSHRIAILDLGLKYTPLGISNEDAQFVQSREISVQDICRFFSVPLYKLQAGKQSYESNNAQAVEYVTGTLMPIIVQYEEEQTWKLLTDSEIKRGLEIKINAMAELRGDAESRGEWYRKMREIGVFNANDIRDLEDMPTIEGGDIYLVSKNYAPLDTFRETSAAESGVHEE